LSDVDKKAYTKRADDDRASYKIAQREYEDDFARYIGDLYRRPVSSSLSSSSSSSGSSEMKLPNECYLVGTHRTSFVHCPFNHV
jgi:hypothetical protein